MFKVALGKIEELQFDCKLLSPNYSKSVKEYLFWMTVRHQVLSSYWFLTSRLPIPCLHTALS